MENTARDASSSLMVVEEGSLVERAFVHPHTKLIDEPSASKRVRAKWRCTEVVSCQSTASRVRWKHEIGMKGFHDDAL